ncbi:uncharacterized protein LOC130299294 [Hyla sarda]|uniref:uncharacterized protein LOC130299294 n=1 Tax=Hyla sarda TaxID=327740 RepID=UPI0024C44862|nr:uncharacterized protein LOC130299294 [Hyla sarda]XP_056407389.1 uncharacterized protein LOC130299294 [Hyla sarda]
MPACVVNGCSPANRGSETLHVFPRDKERIRTWLMATGQYSDNLEEAVNKIFDATKKSDSYRMCAKHFPPYCFVHNPKTGKKKLTKNAVPSIFPQQNATGDTATALPPATKRKRGEIAAFTTALKPGDCCPTCSQVIPSPSTTKPSSSTAEKSVTQAEKATEFNRFYGTLNKKIQNTPRMFSVKTQCSLIRLRRPVPKTSQRKVTVLPEVSEKSETSVDTIAPISTVPAEQNPKKVEPTNLTNKIALNVQEEHYAFNIVLPEIPPLSPPIIEEEPPPLTIPLKDEESTCHMSEDSDSESLSTDESGESEDSQEDDDDEGEEVIFSKRNFGDAPPYYIHPVKQRKFIIFENSLDELILKIPCQSAKCTSPITKIVKKRTGSYISIFVECADHDYNLLWESQPTIDGKPLGNVILASAIFESGNSFPKMKQFFHLMNIMAMSENAYSKYQHDYIFPTIENSWKSSQMESIENVQGPPVCISGDGRWDSTINNKYCVYSMMDMETKKILSFDVQRSAMGVSSPESEKIACKNALDFLLQNEISVKLLCTDRHFPIRKMVKEKYPTITHEFNVRQIAKSVGDKLLDASHEKDCEDLAEWVGAIQSHLRWCSDSYNGDDSLLVAKWNSILYHVQNVHAWEDKDGKYSSCQHKHLPEDTKRKRKWLKTNSPSFKALKKIVLDKRLRKDMKRICHFCHTGDIEVFLSAIVKYQSDQKEQQHVTIDEMYARTQLAALDHNTNCRKIRAMARRSSRTSAGSHRYNTADPRDRRERYGPEMYEPTNQDFLIDLMQEVVELVSGNRSFEWSSHTSSAPEHIIPDVKPVRKSIS